MTRPIRWKLADLAAVPKNGARVLTTFSCGGGSSMGYKLEGFDVVAANDIDPVMARHYKANHNPQHYFLCPIKELVPKLPRELFGIDVLDGSPPCSTFSTAGLREKAWGVDKHFREGQAKQVLDDLFFDFLDVVEEVQPKIVVAENVKGMIAGNAKGYVRAVMKRLDDLGYAAQTFLVNGADCGLPQLRERVFFVAIRRSFNAPPLKLSLAGRWVSSSEAMAAVENSKEELDAAFAAGNQPTFIDHWSRVLPGDNFARTITKERGKRSFFSWTKINPNTPCPTIPAGWKLLFHWNEPRRLTINEIRVLSSFPDDYVFESESIGGYMMGMSVPPYMMAAVAGAIKEQWLKHIL
jgi:DNA (cytosine-5)-methyltransferase 1